MDGFDLLAVQGTLKSLLQHHSSKASILQCLAFFMVQLVYPYMTTRKTTALTIQTSVGKAMPLLFNVPSRLAIAFLEVRLNAEVHGDRRGGRGGDTSRRQLSPDCVPAAHEAPWRLASVRPCQQSSGWMLLLSLFWSLRKVTRLERLAAPLAQIFRTTVSYYICYLSSQLYDSEVARSPSK